MPVTIRDVAERAGVSTATVSYVINNQRGAVRISAQTKESIWRAIRELGYHPNALARGLAGKRTHNVALVMQYASIFSSWSGFTSEMMHGIAQAALKYDVDLLLHTRERDDVRSEALALGDGRVDGALLLRDWDDPLIDLLVEHQFPTALIFTRSRNTSVPYACCDDELGGRIAAEYLLALGHTRILHLTGSSHSSAAQDRLKGFTAALLEAGIRQDPALVLEVGHGEAPFEAAVAVLLSRRDVTAIFAWSDDVALRAMAEVRSLGIRVPEDLSVVGFDSTTMCDHFSPPLTSVAQDIPAIADAGMRMLSQCIAGNEVQIAPVVLAPHLCVRSSAGPAVGVRPR